MVALRLSSADTVIEQILQDPYCWQGIAPWRHFRFNM